MPQSFKSSSFIIIALIFLLPLFFIPGGVVPIAYAKSALFILAVILAALFFIFESWRKGFVNFPKSYILYAAAVLPLIYLLSALLSTPSALSLFGYNFEVGTFGFVLLGASFLVLAATSFTNSSRALQALLALFSTLFILVIFASIKIISGGNILVLGNFAGNMGNPLGDWTDLAVACGLLSVLSIIAVGMLSMKGAIRVLLYVVFLISTSLLIVINFQTAFIITLGASILVWLYFAKVEKQFLNSRESGRAGKLLPIILGVISLLFIINPVSLSARLASITHINNADVRPTLGATLGISKAVLSQVALLGSGPNTFGHDWQIFKPVNVNTTPFWGVAFPYGVGFLPTQIATTGILGTAIWLAFFLALITLALKTINKVPESRAVRLTLIGTLFTTLFLWTGSLLYTPTETMLILAFIFAGVFISVAHESAIVTMKSVNLRGSSAAKLVSVLVVALATIGVVYLGWISSERAIAAYHFQKASTLANIDGTPIAKVEVELNQAVKFAPLDVYYRTIAMFNFSKAQSAATATGGAPEENRATFQDALSKSIAAARAAVSVNPAGSENWVTLGSIYSALVPDPLKVAGAYENAQFAYNEAYKRNPNDPKLPLLLAQLEFNKGNIDAARSYIQNAISLKADYSDAYLMLAQLETSQNNLSAAINSTKALAQLEPNNASIHFELGVLEYSNGEYGNAESELSKALQLVPTYANAKFYLAMTISKLGRTDEAIEKLQELLVSNPDNAELKAAIEQLSSPTAKKKK